MARPPLAKPLFFFFLLLVLGGAAGAFGSIWWGRRWKEHDAAEERAAPWHALPLVESSMWANRDGWRWLIEPTEWSSGTMVATSGGILGFAAGKDGVDVFLSRAEEYSDEQLQPRFEAVAVDVDGQRIATAEDAETSGSGGTTLRHFRFGPDDAPAESSDRIGIEVLMPEVRPTP